MGGKLYVAKNSFMYSCTYFVRHEDDTVDYFDPLGRKLIPANRSFNDLEKEAANSTLEINLEYLADVNSIEDIESQFDL